MSFEFRDYQEQIIEEGVDILFKHRMLYLSMQVRTGKTLIGLGIGDWMNSTGEEDIKHVLFLTKKKAISDISADSDKLCPSYGLFIINYESMHKLPPIKWDIIIIDEAHGLGAIPKPTGRAKGVAELIRKHNPYVVLMSGTPTPESYGQMYHQVFACPSNPFKHHKNFYSFAKEFVDVRQRKINGRFMNDYTRGLDTIIQAMEPYTIRYTQKEAGFKTEIAEEVLYVQTPDDVAALIDRLEKDLVIQGKDEVLLADTPVKLMSKVHQLSSGTVKFESGKSMVINPFKANFIRDKFDGNKIAIFYKFKAELKALKEVFGKDMLTEELEEFNTTNKNIALQIVSGREGISLRNADFLVYFNIDFSAVSYWQSRDRMTTMLRPENKVYWVFGTQGIESDIYKAVNKKKSYTVRHFLKNDKKYWKHI